MSEWRPINDFPDYSVSSDGQIMRTVPDMKGRLSGRPLKATPDTYGYLQAHLFNRGGKRTVKVHTAVCEAFHGRKPSNAHQVAHGDGNKLNNSAGNLRWVTAKENADDRDRHGRTARGERHPSKVCPGYLPTGSDHWSHRRPEARTRGERHGCARLTERDVRAIRRDSRKNIEIAAEFGVTPTTIGYIKAGKTWSHVV